MTSKFKKFLEEHNCLDDYNNYADPNDISVFNFDWGKTKQGCEYWSKLYKLWIKGFGRNQSEKSKIYVYQYCIISGYGTYNTGFVERRDKITSSKEALLFKILICNECGLDEKDCSIINLNIIGERDEEKTN